jgi:polysaccharide biosynthesis/export protein
MRTAIWSAILAALPLLCSGMTEQQTPPAAPLTATNPAKTAGPAVTDPAKVGGPAIPPASTVDNASYVIGPDDQIMVRVWGDDRLSGQLLVRPDGRVSINLIGEVVASGKTPEQLAKDIEEVLRQKEILTRPNVTVNVTQVLSKKYMLNGEVNKPGSVPLTTPTTVMEALVQAGGFRDFADKKHIQIIRGAKRFTFNWNEVIKGKKLQQNILLEPGDIVIVK